MKFKKTLFKKQTQRIIWIQKGNNEIKFDLFKKIITPNTDHVKLIKIRWLSNKNFSNTHTHMSLFSQKILVKQISKRS